MINFNNLRAIYNSHIDSMIAKDGLSTECSLIYEVSKKNLCPNCIFDTHSNRSSNRYKVGGPVIFTDGRTCPYCNGIGFYGETSSIDKIYLIVLWDSKSWMNFPTNVTDIDGYIQTICRSDLVSKIQSANYLVVKGSSYQLDAKPEYAGLGDNNYIVCTWKKINAISN